MPLENISELREEFKGLSDKYYDTLLSSIEYTRNNKWRHKLVGVITVVVFFLLLLTIFGVIPSLIQSYLQSVFGAKIELNAYFSFPLHSIEIILLIVLSILILFFWLLIKISNFIVGQDEKYGILSNQYPFINLRLAIDYLNNYLINERNDYLEKSMKELSAYMANKAISLDLVTKKRIANERSLVADLIDLENKISWLFYKDDTSTIIKAYSDFREKIILRVRQKQEIDKVIIWLADLMYYEYCTLNNAKKINLKSSEKSPNEIGHVFLLNFARQVNVSKRVTETSQNVNENLIVNLKKKTAAIISLFTHDNVLVLFFSWLFLLGFIFSCLLYFGLKFYPVKVDSTILIGYFSAILIGAITITSAIYTKKSKTDTSGYI